MRALWEAGTGGGNVSFKRRHSRPDAAQEPIVSALRDIPGMQVWVIGRPCDLLTLYRKRWLPLEIKSDTASARNRKDQDKQKEFLRDTGTPVVKTALEAIEAVTKHGAINAS